MRLLFILFVVLFLSGCGPIYETTYSYIPPKSKSGKMCVLQCEQSKMMCEQSCDVRKENCRLNARQQGFINYEEYTIRRKAEGKKSKTGY